MRAPASVWSLSIVSLLLFGGCTQAPPAAPPVDQAAIGAAVDSITAAFAAAVAARDTNTIATMYAEDARLMPPNAPRVDGRDAIRTAWGEFMRMPGMELVPTPTEKLISESGDQVVEVGSYVFRFQDAGGKAQTDNGKYVTVYRRVNGELKIVVDMFNSDIPVPGL